LLGKLAVSPRPTSWLATTLPPGASTATDTGVGRARRSVRTDSVPCPSETTGLSTAAAATGWFVFSTLAARNQGQPPVPLTCAGGGPTTQDFVLDAAEQTILNTVVGQMNAALEAEAQARGYAFVSLDALYGAPGVRVPLNVVALVTSPTPFGPFMSLDGLHPSAAGQTLIAQAAAQALNARYDLGIPTP